MTHPAIRTLDETVLPADALPLPPQRRMLIFLLLALTALLHVATAGWGPVEEGGEGWNAAVARELAVGVEAKNIGENWGEKVSIPPAARVMAQSFQIFGIGETAARLPFVLANLWIVWLVYLIAERLAGQNGLWRGLSSGIIAATCCGAILLGRSGGGAALTAAIFMTALYAACRMLEQQSHIRWQFFFWGTLTLLLGLREPFAGILLVVALLTAGLFHRVARYRLRWGWWCAGAAGFVAVVFYGWGQGWWLASGAASGQAWWRALVALFPWSAVVLPALFLQCRRVVRWHDFHPHDAMLWVLGGLIFLWVSLAGSVQDWSAGMACFWPVAALLTGLIWERSTSGMRIVGIVLVALLAGAAFFFCTSVVGREWSTLLRPIWWMSCSVVAGFAVFAIISVKLRHSRAALLTIAASVIPLAFNLVDARSRKAWSHDTQELATGPEGGFVPVSRVFAEEPTREIGAFIFHAPRSLQIIPLKDKKWPSLGPTDFILARPGSAPVVLPWKVVASSPTRILIGAGRR